MNDFQKDYTEFICEELEKCKTLFVSKNCQYTVDDPLVNFRKGAMLMFGAEDGDLSEMYRTLQGYETKHIVQFYNGGIDSPKVEESLRDIIVYSAIALYLVHKNKEAKNNEKAG